VQVVLEVAGLHKSFGELEVLKGIDLKVLERELVFIIGPSGSGKSTLLRCCNRLEEPTSGSIRVAGTDIMAPGVDINAVRRRIGMVFQSFNLYPHLNALGNVTLALRKVLKKTRPEAEEIGMRALGRVGLADKAKAYPNELSGGQQQRVAIARAVVADPTIIVADEPTGDLDRVSAADILAMLQRLNRELGKTIIMVTHDANAAKAARSLLHLEKGELLVSP